MRKLSKFEQAIMLEMRKSNNEGFRLANLTDNFLEKTLVEFSTLKRGIMLRFPFFGNEPTPDDQEYALKRFEEVERMLIELCIFIDELSNERWLFKLQDANNLNTNIRFGQGAVNLNSIECPFLDDFVYDTLKKFYGTKLILTSEAIDFVDHNFKTELARKELFQKRMSIAGLVVAIVIGLWGVLKDQTNSNKIESRIEKIEKYLW